jgi:hypothetical protein
MISTGHRVKSRRLGIWLRLEDKTCIRNFGTENSSKRRANNIKVDLREVSREDGTDSGSCPMASFGISGAEPWGWRQVYGTTLKPVHHHRENSSWWSYPYYPNSMEQSLSWGASSRRNSSPFMENCLQEAAMTDTDRVRMKAVVTYFNALS